jgi:hypothetical protein
MTPRPRFEDEQFSLLPVKRSESLRIPAHQADSETSREAALRIQPKAEGLRYEVLSVIADADQAGATRKEIEAATGMLTQTVCPRLVELEQSGDIRKWTYFDSPSRSIKTVKRDGCAVYLATGSDNAAA